MLVLLKILDVTDESILTNTYIEKDDLESMFNNAPETIPENLYFPFETPKRNLATILPEHSTFKMLQKVILEKKQSRSAKCQACRKGFNVGDIILKIENYVVVPYGSNKAVVNTILCCLNRLVPIQCRNGLACAKQLNTTFQLKRKLEMKEKKKL